MTGIRYSPNLKPLIPGLTHVFLNSMGIQQAFTEFCFYFVNLPKPHILSMMKEHFRHVADLSTSLMLSCERAKAQPHCVCTSPRHRATNAGACLNSSVVFKPVNNKPTSMMLRVRCKINFRLDTASAKRAQNTTTREIERQHTALTSTLR